MIALSVEIITPDGQHIVVNFAEQIIYTKICPYLEHEFKTENSAKLFCTESHRVMYCKKTRPAN